MKSYTAGSLFVLALFALPFEVCAQNKSDAVPPAVSELRAAVDAGNSKFLQAMKTGDVNLMVSLFAPNGMQMAPGEPIIHGRAALRDVYTGFFKKLHVLDGSITTKELGVSGKIAYELGNYVFHFQSVDKSEVTSTGHYMEVWEHQPDGSWNILVDAAQPDPKK
ncbi:MAG: nuclear transport factor 2 family protein [Candidatus Eremiobacteraeota bacterium]|nr:nuclear transport factor 2 family protein [Candidatus Eremiobacteraeota bacterium]